MGGADRSRLETVFLEALERPAEEREEFLRAECAADPELIPVVREMVEGERRTRGASAVRRPVWETATLRFGPYRVTGRIGSGGMGVVYEAVRDDDEFHKRVAIKTISPALLTDYGARKLRAERQILAQLEHPNIARLLDGGTTPEGLPYVVMEFIDGAPLTAHAEARKLERDARLRMFLEICAAVEFAHANLVVHADLKPANILITPDGHPKLLDFGLARLMDRGDATVIGALTPDYASPEQFSGGRITTASDVYSLGVLLHELLTGRVPARDSRDRSVTGAGKELDNIVAMAMRTEPLGRYRSVAALAEDIRRFLHHYPVRARRESVAYRARKFARRNRVGLAAAALLAASLVAGVAATRRQAEATRQHFEEGRALAHSLLFDTYDRIAELPGATAARISVVSLANQYLDRLAGDPNADLSLRKDLAISYRRLGEIRGWPYRANLGDTKGALANLRRSEELLERCSREKPEDPATAFELAKTENGLGVLLVRSGNPYEAETWQSRALQRSEALLRRDPRSAAYRTQLAATEIYLGQALYIHGERDRKADTVRQALRNYAAAEAMDTAFAAEHPDDPEAMFQVGRASTYVGYAHWLLAELEGARDHYRLAMAEHRRALDWMRRAHNRAPRNAQYARATIGIDADAARSLWLSGERSAAVEMLRGSMTEGAERAAAEPENREAQFDYAEQCRIYAEWMFDTGNLAQGLAWSRQTFELYAGLERGDPENEELATRTIGLHNRLGDYFAARRNDRKAAAEYRSALSVAARLHSPTAPRIQAEERAKLYALSR